MRVKKKKKTEKEGDTVNLGSIANCDQLQPIHTPAQNTGSHEEEEFNNAEVICRIIASQHFDEK